MNEEPWEAPPEEYYDSRSGSRSRQRNEQPDGAYPYPRPSFANPGYHPMPGYIPQQSSPPQTNYPPPLTHPRPDGRSGGGRPGKRSRNRSNDVEECISQTTQNMEQLQIRPEEETSEDSEEGLPLDSDGRREGELGGASRSTAKSAGNSGKRRR